MARTYRNRLKHTDYTNKERFLNWTRICWWDEVPINIYDERDWLRFGLDCSNYGVGKRKDYRELTNRIIRNKTKNDIRRIMNNPEDYDDITFATKADGKVHIWSIW